MFQLVVEKGFRPKEKLQHDVSQRPQAMDFTEEAYADMPIEDFGAAMLRGMGWKEGSALEGLSQLQPGDHLVHRQHGIGLYRGLQVLRTGRDENELLCIEYAGADKLSASMVKPVRGGRRRKRPYDRPLSGDRGPAATRRLAGV